MNLNLHDWGLSSGLVLLCDFTAASKEGVH